MDEEQLVKSATAQGVRVRTLGEFCMGEVSHTPTVVLGYGGMDEEQLALAVRALARAWK